MNIHWCSWWVLRHHNRILRPVSSSLLGHGECIWSEHSCRSRHWVHHSMIHHDRLLLRGHLRRADRLLLLHVKGALRRNSMHRRSQSLHLVWHHRLISLCLRNLGDFSLGYLCDKIINDLLRIGRICADLLDQTLSNARVLLGNGLD